MNESIPSLAIVISQYTSQVTDGRIQRESLQELLGRIASAEYLNGTERLDEQLNNESPTCSFSCIFFQAQIETSSALSYRQYPGTLLHRSVLKLTASVWLIGEGKSKIIIQHFLASCAGDEKGWMSVARVFAFCH